MVSLLLVVIYAAFISLGLPDSLLGSAWPVMHADIGAPVSYAGALSMIISAGTIISSLMSDKIGKRLGTGLVTALSVAMTAFALFGFSFSKSFAVLCVFAVPYGLGAGSVDAALNNYIALHYSSRHMSWLHCFWGVGASVSPYIMSFCLAKDLGWAMGYRSVGILQVVLTAALFFSLPMWKRCGGSENGEQVSKEYSLKEIVKTKGVLSVLITFFCYCAMESSVGLWASTYLVGHRGVDAETAAMFASLFYLGITAGRFLSGIVSTGVGDIGMIRIGIGVLLLGIAMIALPLGTAAASLAGLVIVGFGCAPIYPSIIHSTPSNFGADKSQAIIGIQMAAAYTGTTLVPPLFGIAADSIGVWVYPFFMLVFAVAMTVAHVMSVRLCKTA